LNKKVSALAWFPALGPSGSLIDEISPFKAPFAPGAHSPAMLI